MNAIELGIKNRYLNAKTAATYLGLSVWSLYRLVDHRAIPFIPLRPSHAGNVRAGRVSLRFDVNALDSWMKRQMVKPVLHPVEFDRVERKD